MLKLVLDLRWSLLTCDNHSCYLCRYLRNQTPSFSALLAALLPHFSQHDVVCLFISQALGVCECLSVCLLNVCVCVCAFRLLCWAIQRNEKENPNSFSPPHSVALHSLPLQAEIAINIVVVVEQLPDTKIKRNVQKIAKRRVETVKTSLAKWKSKEDERHGREWAEGAWMNKLKSEKKNRKQNRNGAQNMKCLCKWNKTVVLLLLLPSHSRLICWSLSAPAGVLIGTLLLQLGSYRSTL